jgi:hypothetical protein
VCCRTIFRVHPLTGEIIWDNKGDAVFIGLLCFFAKSEGCVTISNEWYILLFLRAAGRAMPGNEG